MAGNSSGSVHSGSSNMLCDSNESLTGTTTQENVNPRRRSGTILSIITPTYHGNMTEKAANEVLTKREAPSYLIRFSESQQKYVLCLATGENTFEHYGLSEDNQRYALDGTDESFLTIEALLEYYQKTPIDPFKPNTCLCRPCYKESIPRPIKRSSKPMQTVKEEPSQVDTDKDLIKSAKPEKELMGEHKSYHQAITGEEAEQRLKRHGGSCYLTRYSEPQECYVLSVYKEIPNNKMKHFKIKIENSHYSIEGTGHAPFEEIGELLSYYERKRIDPAFETIGTAYEEQQYLQDLREEQEREEQEEREREEQEKRERQEREKQEERERQEREQEREEQEERERQEREQEREEQEERGRQGRKNKKKEIDKKEKNE